MEAVRTHRVGSVTTGLTFIAFGILFFIHLFTGAITYEMIFRLWPTILIGLGIELLLSNFIKDKIVYDKGAIFLVLVMAMFAMCMAGADWMFVHFSGGL